MTIEFHRRFVKKYNKLPLYLQRKIQKIVMVFESDPFDISLRNHALRGKMYGKRSIFVTGDMRIIYEEIQDRYVVVFLDVGGHEKVYK